ncbi:MAG TPA: hypothetical protein VGH33_28770 [Isosphaeraceae bacterium]
MLDRSLRPPAIGVALIAATLGGCANELGPESFPSSRVEGTIRIAGRPVSSGWIEFLPAEGTAGNLRSAPILRDGTYGVDGVPRGRVVVRLVGVYGPPIPTSLGPVELATFRSFLSPIRRAIDAQPTSHVDLELASEAEAHQRRRLEASRQMNDPRG